MIIVIFEIIRLLIILK